jgi:hypothetical protein
MWRTKDSTPRLWARHKPSGEPWSEAIAVTPDDGRLLGEYGAAIGARGHVAMAWITGNSRKIHLVRLSPTR